MTNDWRASLENDLRLRIAPLKQKRRSYGTCRLCGADTRNDRGVTVCVYVETTDSGRKRKLASHARNFCATCALQVGLEAAEEIERT